MMKRTLIVCFDLDGVIATGTTEEVYSDKAGWAYEKCEPLQKTIDLIWELRNESVHIIIHTARPVSDTKKTISWLDKHGVAYDELVMGKPYAHVYVDDRNFPVPFDPHAVGIRTALISQLEKISQLG
jgi:uncharacterized HAD superfamily protein